MGGRGGDHRAPEHTKASSPWRASLLCLSPKTTYGNPGLRFGAGGFFHRDRRGFGSNGFLAHRDLHRDRNVLVQLDRNVEFAHGLQRNVEIDLAAVDREALGFQRVRDVGRGDRAEQLIVLARLAGKRQFLAGELLSQGFRAALFLGSLAHRGGLHLLDDGLVAGGRFNRQLVRDEVVAAIALGNFHHVAAMAELVYVFLQNDFHVSNSVSMRECGRSCAAQRWMPDNQLPVTSHQLLLYRLENRSSAVLRACLMGSARRRWCGVHTPVKRRGTILPDSATNCPSRRTSL